MHDVTKPRLVYDISSFLQIAFIPVHPISRRSYFARLQALTRWKNPEYRAKMQQIRREAIHKQLSQMIEGGKTLEARQNRSIAAKKRYGRCKQIQK